MRKSLLIKDPPVTTCHKEGVIYTGRRFEACGEEVYETDIYRDGELQIRHFTYETGWQNYNVKSGLWDCASLSWIDYGGRSYYTAESRLTCEYEDKAYRELMEGSSSIHWQLMNMESSARREREIRAEDRKQLRIDAKMEKLIPPLPKDFRRFISSKMIGRRSALLKDGELFCGSCGSSLGKRQKEKTGDMVTCPHCRNKLVFTSRSKSISWTKGLQMWQECSDGKYVERQFDVTYHAGPGYEETIKITELARGLSEFPGDLWDDWFYGKMGGYYGSDQHFWDRKNRSGVTNLRKKFTLYDSNFSELPFDERTISVIRALQRYNEPLDWGWVIRRAHDHTFEAVVKSGIRGLAIQKAKGEDLQLPLGSTCTKLNEILCISRQQLRTIREIDGTYISVSAFQEFDDITKEELKVLEKYAKGFTRRNLLYSFKKKGIPITHVVTLLEKTTKVREEDLTMYRDYLDMAQARGSDIHDEIIYRNKRWKEYHDRYVLEAEKEKLYQKNHKFPAIKKDYKQNMAIFGFLCGDYEFIVPREASDIVAEGHMQHNCVGASDRYLTKMATGQTWIVFLRKKDTPKQSFYTIEIDRNKILQAYSAYNRKDEWNKVEPVLKKWHREVKKRMKKIGATA